MGRVKVSKAEKIKVKQGVEDDGDKVSSSSSSGMWWIVDVT